jgi:hypothetical protein
MSITEQMRSVARLASIAVVLYRVACGLAWSATVPIISDTSATPPGLSQTSAPLYGKAFTLTINGQNFAQGAQVAFGNTSLATSFVSAAQLTGSVPESALVAVGTFPVKVTNPDGAHSNAVDFFVLERGDFNGNGRVNIADALFAARRAGGMRTPPLAKDVGDLNLDGNADTGDSLVLARYAGREIANLPAPSIASISANPAGRGATVTLTGTGFSTVAPNQQVVFQTSNGTARVTPAAATATTLTVTVPSDAVSGPIQVVRLDSSLAGHTFPLTIEGTPVPLLLTSISPFYFAEPGKPVTLTGMGFDSNPAGNTVVFRSASGTTSRTSTAVMAGTLTVDVPLTALCGTVMVSTGNRTSNARTLVVAGTTCPLQIADLNGGGDPGDLMLIEGSGFDVVTPSNNIVKFAAAGGGNVTAPVLQAGETQLHLRIPDAAVDGDVSVSVGSAVSNKKTFRTASAVVPGFVDVIVSSTSAVGSYEVTIGYDKNIIQLSTDNVAGGTGNGFTGKPSKITIDNANGTVKIGHLQQGQSPTGTFTVARLAFTGVAVGVSNLTLTVTELKDSAGNGIARPPAEVRLSSGSVRVIRLPDAPTAAPLLSSITPKRAPVGSSLTYNLTGSNFVIGGTTVSAMGTGVTVSSVSVTSPHSLSVVLSIASTAAVGARDVTVQTSAGSGSTSLTITAPPAISSLSPASAVAGKMLNTMRINGSNLDLFSSPAVVFIPQTGTNPEAAFRVNDVSVESASAITLSVQVGSSSGPVSPGTYRVEIRDDVSAPQIRTQAVAVSGVNVFEVIPAPPVPTLSSIVPAAGLQGESITLALTGTNFISGATTVSISGTGVVAGTVTVMGSTSAVVPLMIAADAAPTARLVTITTGGGTTDALAFAVLAREFAPSGVYSASAQTVRLYRSFGGDGESLTAASPIIRAAYRSGLAEGTQDAASAIIRAFFDGPPDTGLEIASRVTSVFACVPTVAIGVNLIMNGDAESDLGASDKTGVVAPSCWTTSGNFGTVRYGGAELPAAGTAGVSFFSGGRDSASSSALQTIDLSSLASKIDSGTLTATLSALLGGYSSEADHMTVNIVFKSAGGTALGSLGIGPVAAADRGNATKLLARSSATTVPSQTRSLVVTMTATRSAGPYNDAYADNVSVVFTEASAEVAQQEKANMSGQIRIRRHYE